MATGSQAARRTVLPPQLRIKALVSQILMWALVALVGVWLVGNFIRTPEQFVTVGLTGITNGAIYGLVALGYTLVYGIIELINFAHGDVFMWGTMVTISFAGWVGLTAATGGGETALLLVAALVGAMVFCGALNAAIERVAYRRLREAPRLAPLITAIGMSLILSNVAGAVYGFAPRSFPDVLPDTAIFTLGNVAYRWSSLIVVLITIPVLIALVYLVQRTRQGKAMRATAQDLDAARLMGIDVDRTISFTFALGGALAGAAGVLYISYFTTTRFDLGFTLGLLAFTAAVLGGIGNLTGAVLGALLIGLIQAFNEGLSWHTPGAQWTTSIVFSILILILVFRPQGLLGEGTSDRA
jgi:branched-chain amino acid transport system permease protein